MTACPKPKDLKRGPGVASTIRVLPDGREVINCKSPAGRWEYRRRINMMAERQGQICCLFGHSPVCHPLGFLAGHITSFEHEHGRGHGGGKRDDRVSLPDGTWINGAAHFACNNWKGSRYINYNRGFRNG